MRFLCVCEIFVPCLPKAVSQFPCLSTSPSRSNDSAQHLAPHLPNTSRSSLVSGSRTDAHQCPPRKSRSENHTPNANESGRPPIHSSSVLRFTPLNQCDLVRHSGARNRNDDNVGLLCSKLPTRRPRHMGDRFDCSSLWLDCLLDMGAVIRHRRNGAANPRTRAGSAARKSDSSSRDGSAEKAALEARTFVNELFARP